MHWNDAESNSEKSSGETYSSTVTPTRPHLHSRNVNLDVIAHAAEISIDTAVESGERKYKPTTKEIIRRFIRLYRFHSIYFLVTTILLVVLIYFSYFAAIMMDGSNKVPERLSCRDWAYGYDCGIWGINCQPFVSDWYAIRCPARCTMDQASSLAVYGSSPYRADSRICRAAIHAGVISSNGGCALLRYQGAANSFIGTTANGVTSHAYDSWFPKTFEFRAAPSLYCTDLTWIILLVGYLIMAGYSLLPRTNPGMLFSLLMTWGFFYVRLVGQPQSVDYAQLVIDSFADIFVVLAISSWIYKIAPIHTFASWKTMTRTQRILRWSICYVLPFHLLINLNLMEYIPWLNIDIGGYNNTSVNAGTYIVYGGLGLFILYSLGFFLRELYRQRLWPSLILWYSGVGAFVFLSWTLFHSCDFHLHHTMLGALLLPLTRFPTPFASIAQSALLGCFIQGYAAWGWAPYLTTKPTYMTIPVPKEPPVIANITTDGAIVSWTPLQSVDGYSLRVNQVEMYRGVDTVAWIAGLQPNMTYYATVSGIADWGVDGNDGPKANFTTLTRNTTRVLLYTSVQ